MADENKIVDSSLDQNPAQIDPKSQDYINNKNLLVNQILQTFIDILPSNYISEVLGPHYTVQFQAIAEQLADLQITLQEELKDSFFDFTRSEYLYQFIGNLVFPDVDETGFPEFDGDLVYREFFSNMVELLLDGSTLSTIKKGLALLSDADFEVIEKAIVARTLQGSAWGFEEQFEFEVNVSYEDGTNFPPNPFQLQQNAIIVLRALKPAHTLYGYRHLFKEAFGPLFEDEVSMKVDAHYYDDLRKFCEGAKSLNGGDRILFGSSGVTVSASNIFEDASQDFITTCTLPGQILYIQGESGGMYEIVQVVSATQIEVLNNFSLNLSDLNWVILEFSGGDTLTDRFLFSDASKDFSNLDDGSILTIHNKLEGDLASTSSNIFSDSNTNFYSFGISSGDILVIPSGNARGSYIVNEITSNTTLTTTSNFTADVSSASYYIKSANTGKYLITEILTLPVITDLTPRTYSTTPSNLSGELVVNNGVIEDVSDIPVDFSTGVSGEILTIDSGPNAGTYRLKTIPGLGGGPIGETSNPSTEVIPAPSIVRLSTRMPEVATDQDYSIDVDRLGVKTPHVVCKEDVSTYFFS